VDQPDFPPDLAPGQPWLRTPLVGSWKEIVLVASLTVAPLIVHSAWDALHGSSLRYMEILVSDGNLLLTMALESGMLGLFLLFLRRRGWQPADLVIKIGGKTSALGLGLWVIGELATATTVLSLFWLLFTLQAGHGSFLRFLIAHNPQIPRHGITVHWTTLVFSMIVNAYTEEILFMGYLFRQLAARTGPAFALLLTVFLRVGCHTYQDPAHVAGIAMLFTIYALWYLRFRSLWPLIFAHIVLDVGSMGLIKLLHS